MNIFFSRPNRFLTVALISSMFAASSQCFGIDIDGYSVPESMSLGDQRLEVNGCGLREMMWSDLYLVSLYLEELSQDSEVILNDSMAKTIHLEIIYDDSLPEDLPEVWREPLREAISTEMFNLVQELYEDLKPGDILRFDYQPGMGTTVYQNDEKVISQDTTSLITSLLKNWIGADPVSRNLKRLLLSQSCE